MDFDGLYTHLVCTQCGGDKCIAHAVQLGLAHGSGGRFVGQVRQCGGSKGFPAALVGCQQLRSLPRNRARCLASRVRELNTYRNMGCQFAGALQGFGYGRRMVIAPQAQALGRDAPLGQNGRRFNGEQGRATVE